MSRHIDRVQASVAAGVLSSIAVMAKDGISEHLHAGGSLPDILQDLKKEGHISDMLYVAGVRLVQDLTRCHGNSGGLTARYGDQVDSGRSDYLPSAEPVDLDAFARVDRVLTALWDHEREVLTFCVLAREARRGTLADFGRQKSAFKTRQQSRAVAVGQIRSMLQSVHEAYRMKIPIPS